MTAPDPIVIAALRDALRRMEEAEGGGLDALTALDDPLTYIEPLWVAVEAMLKALIDEAQA
jgi:hypothetical protein